MLKRIQITTGVRWTHPGNCERSTGFVLGFDKEGNVCTPWGKDGKLYELPPQGCVSKTTVRLQAQGPGVSCLQNCSEKR